MTVADFDRLRAEVAAANADVRAHAKIYAHPKEFLHEKFATVECAVILLDCVARHELRVVENLDVESLVHLYVEFLKAACDWHDPKDYGRCILYASCAPGLRGVNWWTMVGLTDRAHTLFEGRDAFDIDLAYGFEEAISEGLEVIGFFPNDE